MQRNIESEPGDDQEVRLAVAIEPNWRRHVDNSIDVLGLLDLGVREISAVDLLARQVIAGFEGDVSCRVNRHNRAPQPLVYRGSAAGTALRGWPSSIVRLPASGATGLAPSRGRRPACSGRGAAARGTARSRPRPRRPARSGRTGRRSGETSRSPGRAPATPRT